MMDFKKAQNFWDEKEDPAQQMPKQECLETIEAFIKGHNTLALATGSGDYVRCTPVEYTWYRNAFWIMSEGGKKFIGLEKNRNVSLAVFDSYGGFGNLKGLQVMGTCEIVEPFSDEYNDFLAVKNIPVEAIKKMPEPMPMLKIVPSSYDYLDSSLKEKGFSVRQHLDF